MLEFAFQENRDTRLPRQDRPGQAPKAVGMTMELLLLKLCTSGITAVRFVLEHDSRVPRGVRSRIDVAGRFS